MIGIYQDKFPRGRVAMRGWDPQNPTKQTIALPVAETAGEKEWIWPGHIMFPTTGADGVVAWTKKAPASGAALNVIAVAQDASVDPDVLAAYSLVGLACSDSYKLATPFFRKATADNYTIGTALTYCASNENVDGTTATAGAVGTAAGYIKPAGADDTIIGYVCQVPDGIFKADHNAMNLQPNFVDAIDSMSVRENAQFIVWNTCYQAKTV